MKNLVFIITDGLRYSPSMQDLPHIKDLNANADVTLIASHPVASSFRASLWTGKSVLGTGVVRNGLQIYPDHQTMPQILTENGYATAFIGEWMLHESAFVHKGRHRLGFDESFVSFSGTGAKRTYCTDSENGKAASPIAMETEFSMATDTLDMLSCGNRPYALFLNIPLSGEIPAEYLEKTSAFPEPLSCGIPMEKHIPSECAENVSDSEKRHRYMAYCAMLDDKVGELLTHISDDTIVVLTSSCGTLFAEHGRTGAGCFFEEAIRLPLFTKNLALSSSMMTVEDFMPTLLSVLSLTVPDTAEGMDITQDKRDHTLLFGMGPENTFADGREWRGIRTMDYAFAVCKRDNSEYLFDLNADPNELKNLASDSKYDTLRSELRFRMLREMHEKQDNFPKNSYYKNYWIHETNVLPFLR